jgi:hypothetical protein
MLPKGVGTFWDRLGEVSSILSSASMKRKGGFQKAQLVSPQPHERAEHTKKKTKISLPSFAVGDLNKRELGAKRFPLVTGR